MYDPLHATTHTILLLALGCLAMYLHYPLMSLHFTDGRPPHRPNISIDTFRRIRVAITILCIIPFLSAPIALLDVQSYSPLIRRIVVWSQVGVSLMSDMVTTSTAQSEYADVALLYAVTVFRGPREMTISLAGHVMAFGVCWGLGALHPPDRTRMGHIMCLRVLLLVCSVWITPGPVVAVRPTAPPVVAAPEVKQ